MDQRTLTLCRSCDKPVEPGQTIVGLPVIRITSEGHSALAGTEIVFHLSCFIKHFAKPKLQLVKP